MDRKRSALGSVVIGIILFVLSMFYLLPMEGFYVPALVIMFAGVILIGIGGAVFKGIDRSLGLPEGECSFCKGTGKISDPTGSGTCPRCGGTGKARADDRS